MKVLEALEKYDKDLKLKIGSRQCYFYVGTVGDIRAHHEVRDDKMRSLLANITRRKKDRLNARLSEPPTWGEFIRKEVWNVNRYERQFTREHYDEYVEQWVKETMVYVKAFDKSVEDEETYIPIAGRTVKECVMCDDAFEEDCVRMIVEGREHGAFWMTAEAKGCTCGINLAEE